MATIIRRQSLISFMDLRDFGRGDRSFNSNTLKFNIWIEHLADIVAAADFKPRLFEYQLIKSMLSIDMRRRTLARIIEQLYLDEYDCNGDAYPKDDCHLVIAHTAPPLEPLDMASRWLKRCMRYHTDCSIPAVDYFASNQGFRNSPVLTLRSVMCGVVKMSLKRLVTT